MSQYGTLPRDPWRFPTPPEYSFPSCKGTQFFHLSTSSCKLREPRKTCTSCLHQPLLTSKCPSVSVLSYSCSPSNPLLPLQLSAHYAHLLSTHSVLDREAINAFLSTYSYDHSHHALVYKPVAKKVCTVPTTMPAEYRVVCQLPEDPLAGMPELPTHPPDEGSTILLGCRTMLGECCLAAIQPKGFWTRLRAQERERESVCVCVCERERERERI
jgi:hypothetical protein